MNFTHINRARYWLLPVSSMRSFSLTSYDTAIQLSHRHPNGLYSWILIPVVPQPSTVLPNTTTTNNVVGIKPYTEYRTGLTQSGIFITSVLPKKGIEFLWKSIAPVSATTQKWAIAIGNQQNRLHSTKSVHQISADMQKTIFPKPTIPLSTLLESSCSPI